VRLLGCLGIVCLVAFALTACGGSSSGVTGLETVHAFYQGDPTDDEKLVEVPCPSGRKALGGGFELAAGGFPVDVQFSEPMGQVGQAPTGWQAFAQETPPLDPADEWGFDAFAICANA
jgi:hypothetical protein